MSEQIARKRLQELKSSVTLHRPLLVGVQNRLSSAPVAFQTNPHGLLLV